MHRAVWNGKYKPLLESELGYTPDGVLQMDHVPRTNGKGQRNGELVRGKIVNMAQAYYAAKNAANAFTERDVSLEPFKCIIDAK